MVIEEDREAVDRGGEGRGGNEMPVDLDYTEDVECRVCGEEFERFTYGKSKDKQFCSRECQNAWYAACRHAGQKLADTYPAVDEEMRLDASKRLRRSVKRGPYKTQAQTHTHTQTQQAQQVQQTTQTPRRPQVNAAEEEEPTPQSDEYATVRWLKGEGELTPLMRRWGHADGRPKTVMEGLIDAEEAEGNKTNSVQRARDTYKSFEQGTKTLFGLRVVSEEQWLGESPIQYQRRSEYQNAVKSEKKKKGKF